LACLRIASCVTAAVARLATDLPGSALIGWASHPLDDSPEFRSIFPSILLLSDQPCLVADPARFPLRQKPDQVNESIPSPHISKGVGDRHDGPMSGVVAKAWVSRRVTRAGGARPGRGLFGNVQRRRQISRGAARTPRPGWEEPLVAGSGVEPGALKPTQRF